MYMLINKDLYLSNVKHQVFVSTSIHLAVLKRVLAKYCWLPILSCSEESGGLWSMESQSCGPWEHNLGTEQQQATPPKSSAKQWVLTLLLNVAYVTNKC